jgi:hypothetical protein
MAHRLLKLPIQLPRPPYHLFACDHDLRDVQQIERLQNPWIYSLLEFSPDGASFGDQSTSLLIWYFLSQSDRSIPSHETDSRNTNEQCTYYFVIRCEDIQKQTLLIPEIGILNRIQFRSNDVFEGPQDKASCEIRAYKPRSSIEDLGSRRLDKADSPWRLQYVISWIDISIEPRAQGLQSDDCKTTWKHKFDPLESQVWKLLYLDPDDHGEEREKAGDLFRKIPAGTSYSQGWGEAMAWEYLPRRTTYWRGSSSRSSADNYTVSTISDNIRLAGGSIQEQSTTTERQLNNKQRSKQNYGIL